MPASRQILIVGCGYVGAIVARTLQARGDSVVGWVLSELSAATLRAEGFTVVTGDVSQPDSWRQIAGTFDAVVHCASSSHGGAATYESVYLEGLRQITSHLPQTRLVFVSSTSVYGQIDGEVVTELSPAEPATETGKILRQSEQFALEQGATVLRLAGIYGPGRGVLAERFKRGAAMIDGDGSRWINQIHRDDAAAAIVHALNESNCPRGEIFNVCEDEPVTLLEFYKRLSAQLQLPMPPFASVTDSSSLSSPKRGFTNKRVSNAKLRATQWRTLSSKPPAKGYDTL